MSQSGLKLPTTSEADVRELVRAKLRAKAAWEEHNAQATSIMSERARIDHEVENIRLCRALNAAEDSLFKATRGAV